jgi:regulator of replication initiation timing
VNTNQLRRRINELEAELKAIEKRMAAVVEERDKAVAGAAEAIRLRAENDGLRKDLAMSRPAE